MSPPQVTVNEKENQEKDPDAPPGTEPNNEALPPPMLVDKSVEFGLDFSTVVSEETESEAEENRRIGRRISYCIFFTVVLVILAVASIVVIPLIVNNSGGDKKEAFNCGIGKTKVKITIDKENEIIFATESKTKFKIVHDYKRRLVGYLDQDGDKCIIDRLDETFEDGQYRWKAYKNIADRSTFEITLLSKQTIPAKVQDYICGHEIYKLCKAATEGTFWGMELDETEKSHFTNTISM